MATSIARLAEDLKAAQNVQSVVGGREAASQAEAARQALAAAAKAGRK